MDPVVETAVNMTHTDAAILARRRKAYGLRMVGGTYRQIAEACGVSVKTSFDDVKAVMEELRQEAREDAETIRAMELERLDTMLSKIWPAVQLGKLLAVDRALKIMERRSRLLGLDAAQKFEHAGKDGGPIETTSEIREKLTPVQALERARELQRRTEIALQQVRRTAPPTG